MTCSAHAKYTLLKKSLSYYATLVCVIIKRNANFESKIVYKSLAHFKIEKLYTKEKKLHLSWEFYRGNNIRFTKKDRKETYKSCTEYILQIPLTTSCMS